MRLLILRWGVCLLGLCLPWQASAVDESSLVVIYPDIAGPYQSVFASIINGVSEARQRDRVTRWPIRQGAVVEDVAAEVKRREPRAVIALGRQGLQVASAMPKSSAVVAAGVLSVPEVEAQDFPVHSLAPDPSLMFNHLRTLAPGIKRVLVVHDPRQNAWLIRLAHEAARAANLELQVWPAEDLKTAVKLFQDMAATADPRRDAIWLLQDSTTVDDVTVLPLMLKASWDQNFVLFSSSIGHVRRGALFALYPDHTALGRTLASATRAASGVQGRGLLPLRDVKLAVNTRTAHHLGISLSAMPARIHAIFPEP